MAVQNTEKAKTFIKRWMEDRRVFKEDTTNVPGRAVFFSYDGTSNVGVNFTIQQPKDIVRVVGITTRLVLDEKQRETLNNRNPENREKFFKTLRFNLLFVDPTYSLGPDPNNPEWVLFIKEISYDELTEGRLITAIDHMNRAVILASSLIVEELGEPAKE